MPPKKTQITRRDAGTGKFVTEEYAKDHPKTTVTETNKITPKSKPSQKKK